MAKESKLVIGGILLVLLMPFVLAIPEIPHQIYGNVLVDGQPAPDGMIISALCDGDTYSTATANGKYGYTPDTFYIVDPYGGRAGETIKIYVNNDKVDELTFANGELSELNIELSASCGDGLCSGEESCSSCSGDCGTCDTGGGNGGGGGGGGGGGSGGRSNPLIQTKTCIEKWACTGWSDVSGACGTRTCTDSNKCGTTILKPIEVRKCEKEVEGQIIEAEPEISFFNKITGAVVGGGRGKYTIPLIFIILIIVVGVLVYVKRKN